MVPFAGWQMPLRYGSETAEHQAVRHAAGLFDLSHMGEITVTEAEAGRALDYALTGYLSAMPPGRARYTMICAADGGVLDDLVVYRLGEQEFLVIANAANTPVVFDELVSRASGFDAVVTDATDDYAALGTRPGECSACHTGRCPVGITTQDDLLSRRLDPDLAARRVANYLRALTMEVTMLARACGKSDVHNLEPEDLAALTIEAAAMARVPLAGTDWIPGARP